jgi:uncharacterized protein
LNELNNQAEAEALDATHAFAPDGYLSTALRTLDDGLDTLARGFRQRIAQPSAGLRNAQRSPALADFLRSLQGRLDWPLAPAKRRRKIAQYLFRTLCMPRRHLAYLAFVYGNPRMCAYVRRDPRVLERHFHRYMHLGWSQRAHLESIRQHYQFALSRLPGVLFEAIYIHGNATLGNLTLKNGTQLQLCLRPPIFMGCEGELCLQLNDANDHPLYRLILSVIDDRPSIAIGCIQGPDGEHARDTVRELTRNMHGMRPKQLMLSLAYAFAQHFGIERILAVSNAAHPLRRAREKFQSDYDAFWLEQKGRPLADGWFMLPESLSRKCESEVPSHHRSAFRRREALRIEAERLLTNALEAHSLRRITAAPGKALESGESFQHDGLEPSWIR